MKAYLITFVLVIGGLCAGCSTHYYQSRDQKVMLHLRVPSRSSVYLYTSLDGFQPQKAKYQNRTWVNQVPSDSSFSYFYKVNGELVLPPCQYSEIDDFGSRNCIYMPELNPDARSESS